MIGPTFFWRVPTGSPGRCGPRDGLANRARLAAVIAWYVVWVAPAAGQVVLLTQERVVSAGSQSFVAPDFGDFFQTAEAENPPSTGYCTLHSSTRAAASHRSALSASSITYELLADSHGIGSSARCIVGFQAPPGTAYTYSGSRRRVIPFGGAGCCLPTSSLSGPGLDFQTSQAIAPSTSAVTFSTSGVLSGGVYLLVASIESDSLCGAGNPVTHLGEASGTLTTVLPHCRTDVDADGQVTPADVAFFVQTWLTSLTSGILAGDFDGNGAVQPADIALFVQAWFTAAAAGGAAC